MAKKKPELSPDEQEERVLEEKVRKMLDPRETDASSEPQFEVIKDNQPAETEELSLPTKIEIKDHTDPATAPVLNGAPQPASHDAPQEPPKEEEPINDAVTPTTTEDPALDKAVDEIVAEESDEIIKNEDKEIQKAFDGKKPSLRQRIGQFFSSWWHNKKARRATIIGVLLALIAVGVVPASRYFVLNTVGVRSSASIQVTDESTLQPLRNVKVTIGGQSALTDGDGHATVQDIKLGTTRVVIEKRAFATIDKKHTIGWGSNPLQAESLTPVGTQYTFKVTDFASGKPLEKVEAINGDASAFSDKEGVIKLTLDMPEDQFEVELIGNQLRTEKIDMNADDFSTRDIKMVPEKKHVFISKRTGVYDVYSVYADGKEETLELKGTGSERDDMIVVSHPTRAVAAVVSTRENTRNDDGFLLSSLYIIELGSTKKPKKVVTSERVQIIGWKDQRLVFVQVASGTSAANPDRHQLKTYNLEEDTAAELASANYFNDVMIAKDIILYAPSSAYAKTPAALYRVKPDGTDAQVVLAEETWSMFRTSHNKVTYTTGRDWYELSIDERYSEKLKGEPARLGSQVFVDNPSYTKSLWVDGRDGKGVLLVNAIEANEDAELVSQSGLKLPVYWLNDTAAVYRVHTEQETADYVVSTEGGKAVKIADVANTTGIDRWYYY